MSELRNALWYRGVYDVQSQTINELEEVVAEYDQLLQESDEELITAVQRKKVWRTVAIIGGAIMLADLIVDVFDLYLLAFHIRVERLK